jgi:hypothetical protein
MRLLSLRPDDSLTILRMALSIDFQEFSFLPPDYSSYRDSDFFPGGLDSR